MDFLKKTQPYTVYKRPTLAKETPWLKVKGWKKTFHANGNQKRTGVAIIYIRQNRI